MKNLIFKFKKDCLKSNKDILVKNLAIQTFGNASQRINENLFVIKPSGINLKKIKSKDLVIIDINSGKKIKSKLKPSSDTETHRILYKQFPNLRGIAHAHPTFLTSWAQTGKSIPNLGTTHSDFSKYSIFVTEQLEESEVVDDYELNTGKKIIETLKNRGISILETPGILSIRHGVFSWGRSIEEALKNAEIIEYLAELCFITKNLNPSSEIIEDFISSKHFNRKHGPNKYYGQ